MPSALSTKAELQQKLLRHRAVVLRAERACDLASAEQAREKCNEILEQILAQRCE